MLTPEGTHICECATKFSAENISKNDQNLEDDAYSWEGKSNTYFLKPHDLFISRNTEKHKDKVSICSSKLRSHGVSRDLFLNFYPRYASLVNI
jgi:hypothetical protein